MSGSPPSEPGSPSQPLSPYDAPPYHASSPETHPYDAPPPGAEAAETADAPPPPAKGMSKLAAWGLGAAFVGLLLGAVGNLVHLPYAVLSPGPAQNVLGQTTAGGKTTDLITVSGKTTYPATGSLDFTTVRVNGGPGYPVNVWDVVGAYLGGTDEIYPVDALFPPSQTATQVQQENTAEMVDSQKEAAAVALTKLGYTVSQKVAVGQVSPDAPSGTVLHVGDVLTSIGGVTVSSSDALRAQIQKATPGATLAVGVVRDGKPLTVQAKTGNVQGRTVLGVVLQIDIVLPFPVTIDAGDVGGPSAGTMFSLGIYDKLTEGSLTGGQNIAGTGTIDLSGAVGPIGGIRQKMVGARDQGATWFLAPADNCTEVVGHVPDGMTAVKISSFDTALAAVTAIGKGQTGSLPHC